MKCAQPHRTILAVFVTSRLLRLGVQKNTIHSDLPKKHPALSCERLQISARAEDDELFPACESRRNELFLRESPAYVGPERRDARPSRGCSCAGWARLASVHGDELMHLLIFARSLLAMSARAGTHYVS